MCLELVGRAYGVAGCGIQASLAIREPTTGNCLPAIFSQDRDAPSGEVLELFLPPKRPRGSVSPKPCFLSSLRIKGTTLSLGNVTRDRLPSPPYASEVVAFHARHLGLDEPGLSCILLENVVHKSTIYKIRTHQADFTNTRLGGFVHRLVADFGREVEGIEPDPVRYSKSFRRNWVIPVVRVHLR